MSGVAQSAMLRQWLPIAVASTVLASVGAFSGQQHLRADADQPQRALVHDVAAGIAAGQRPDAWMPAPIELEWGQGVFLAAYDAAGKPQWSSARLAGQLPEPPPGVFRNAGRGEYSVTWQPSSSIRQALVIVPNPGHGYLLAGHSLQAAEASKRRLLGLWAGAWLLALVGALLACGLVGASAAIHD